MGETLLRGASVLDSERHVFTVHDLFIQNGKFADPSLASEKVEVRDLSGKYIIPGLIDVHTHGRAGYDFNRCGTEDYPRLLASYAAAGTTSVMATLASDTLDALGASIDGINAVRKANAVCKANAVRGELSAGLCARILGIHLEGRYLNSEKRGVHDPALLAPPSVMELSELMPRMRPLPTHLSCAPELDGGMEFIRRAVALGATVGIAHSNADAETTKKALDAGASSFTHLYNAMRPLHHRDPGNTCVGLISGAYAEIICDGLHVHPDMVRLAYLAKGRDRLVLITDSMEAAGCADGAYEIAGTRVFVADGRALTQDGVLAGSLLSLFDGVNNLCRFAGVSYVDAVLCATKNPARMIGVYDRVGSIAPGKSADLLVLSGCDVSENSAPRLEKVCVAGIFAD